MTCTFTSGRSLCHGASVSREKSSQALPPIFLQSCETKSRTESLGTRLNPCWPDRTRQVTMSGRSRNTHSQAVKSLPARPHSATHNTLIGTQIPAGQTALSRSPRHGGAATHVHRRSNPCRPDHTQQVAVSGRSRNTDTRGQPCWPDHTH